MNSNALTRFLKIDYPYRFALKLDNINLSYFRTLSYVSLYTCAACFHWINRNGKSRT